MNVPRPRTPSLGCMAMFAETTASVACTVGMLKCKDMDGAQVVERRLSAELGKLTREYAQLGETSWTMCREILEKYLTIALEELRK